MAHHEVDSVVQCSRPRPTEAGYPLKIGIFFTGEEHGIYSLEFFIIQLF